MRRRRAPGTASWLTTQPMKALWETGFGTDASRFWVLQNIVASVEPFRGQEHPKTGLCIRLPLGAGDAYAAAVWMDMTLRLARWKNTLLNAFWVAATDDAHPPRPAARRVASAS